MLEIPFDPLTLYRCDDRSALIWFSALAERVFATRREQAARIRSGR